MEKSPEQQIKERRAKWPHMDALERYRSSTEALATVVILLEDAYLAGKITKKAQWRAREALATACAYQGELAE